MPKKPEWLYVDDIPFDPHRDPDRPYWLVTEDQYQREQVKWDTKGKIEVLVLVCFMVSIPSLVVYAGYTYGYVTTMCEPGWKGSMWPSATAGDSLIMRYTLDKNLTGTIVVAWAQQYNENIVHRVIKDFGSYVLTKGDNNKIPESFFIDKGYIIGQVVWIIHDSKC